MKPRTKLEKEVFALSKELKPVSRSNKDWAFNKLLEHLAYATKTKASCMDCGKSFSPNLINRKRATCPHCGTKLKIKGTRKRTFSQSTYFAVAEVYKGYQVIRNFEITSHHKTNKRARITVFEVLQYWVNDKNKTTIVGHLRNHSWSGGYWGGDWSIRKDHYAQTYHYHAGKYIIYPDAFAPHSKFKKEYRKFGINRNFDGLNFLDAISIIPNNPIAETLLKAKQYHLLYHFKNNSDEVKKYWNSIKICIRNGYKVKHARTYMDYISLLEYFGKDLRNSKYVCPKDLDKEHNRYVAKHEKALKKKALEEQRKEVAKAQKMYVQKKKAYIGLTFVQGNIQIKFLNSVNEVMQEGDKLEHCVFASKYYERDSLLFTAIIEGEKIATLEFDPSNNEILQIRGKFNQTTEFDEDIKKVFKKNIKKVQQRSKVYAVAS
ncbi:PcfJ domain-containing protein [Galbibacter sp. BG1]